MNARLIEFAVLPLLALASNAAAQPRAGQVLWNCQLPGGTSSSPALAADGTLYLEGQAITNNGTMASNKWTAPFWDNPAIGPDATIYSGNDWVGGLTAVSPDGSVEWRFPASGAISTPAVAADGTIYFQDFSGLHAVSPSGREIWRSLPGDYTPPPPAVGPDGTIYADARSYSVKFAISPLGARDWTYPRSGDVALLPDGTILAAVDGLCAIAPAGTNRWCAGRYVVGPPTVGPDGTIYASTSGARSLVPLAPTATLSGRPWGTPRASTCKIRPRPSMREG